MPTMTQADIKKRFGCKISLESPTKAVGSWYNMIRSRGCVRLLPNEDFVFVGKIPQIRKCLKDHGTYTVMIDKFQGETYDQVWIRLAGVMMDGRPGSVAVDCVRQIFAGGVGNISGMNVGMTDAGPALGYVADSLSIAGDFASIGTNTTSGTGKVTRAMHWLVGDKVQVTINAAMPPVTSRFSNPRMCLQGPTVTWAALSDVLKTLATKRAFGDAEFHGN